MKYEISSGNIFKLCQEAIGLYKNLLQNRLIGANFRIF